MHLTVITALLFSIFVIIENRLYLLNTQDGPAVEYYDCILVRAMTYCRRPDYPIDLSRTHQSLSCEMKAGIAHQFKNLRSHNVTVSTILHQWKSSIEQVERYSRYQSTPDLESDEFVCECQRERSFGKYCEYELPVGDTFQQTLDWQVEMRQHDEFNVLIHGNITCYEGVSCDSGRLCLDWREICDGVQNCMNGRDEEQCDLLELNTCGKDEYRCTNGMCIPDEYFLDGDLDCLDWSDEMNVKSSEDCASEGVSEQCDDHMCLSKQWPCGDGQCIVDRFAFQRSTEEKTCINRRDQSFLCETHASIVMWTMSNGRCNRNETYKALTKIILTEEERCEYLLKCALSQGGAVGCPCTARKEECANALAINCSLETIQYPRGAFPNAYTQLFFNRNRSLRHFFPDFVLINGSLKWQGTPLNVAISMAFNNYSNAARAIETTFCAQRNSTKISNQNLFNQCFNLNESTSMCDEWNLCMSIHRIRDGNTDCFNKQDETNRTQNEVEKSCASVRYHRFRCSSEEPTCLSVFALGNGETDCQNRYDEVWRGGVNRKLSQISCNQRWKDECAPLRQYIEQSWSSHQFQDISPTVHIPFRSYCDTFANFDSVEDENLLQCRKWWVCAMGQWQCGTGQCIDQKWFSDGEWDCVDGSDENILFTNTTIWMYKQVSIDPSTNSSLISLDLCAENSSFLCLSPHPAHRHFRCLNFSQLSDHTVDCLGAIDERNTLRDCSNPSSSALLGHNYLCPSTNTCVSYYQHCKLGHRCSNAQDDQQWCHRDNAASDCFAANDFRCFDGRCVSGGRCNHKFDCPYGEDEYMCDYSSHRKKRIVPYRKDKEDQDKSTQRHTQLPFFPNHTNTTMSTSNEITVTPFTIGVLPNASSLTLLSSYACNRGVGILSNNQSIVCFCPPQYYGSFCQYHADRLLILLHLNLSQSIYTLQSDITIVIKLLVLFLFDEQVVMAHEFHVRPATESSTYTKKLVHFLYSRSSVFRQHRMQRYMNRSNIITSQPYAIRIEAYERKNTDAPSVIAAWQYPVFFDYLPVYRFSKVLHLIKPNTHFNSCSSNPCPPNTLCQPLINDKSRYICLCKSNFTGRNCTIADEQCVTGYCAPQSLCKPDYRRLLEGNATPYCICAFNRIGERCDVVHDYCHIIPCFNNGSCFPTSSPNKVECICTKNYRGFRCQFPKPSIRLSLIDHIHYQGAVLQYFDLDFVSLDLTLVWQKAHIRLPSSIEYLYNGVTVPEIVLAKIYLSHDEWPPDLYLLSISVNVTTVEGTTQISDSNRCAHVNVISNGKSFPV